MAGAFPSRRIRVGVLAALGTGGVALAGLLWFAPGAVPAAVRTPLLSAAGSLRGPAVAYGLAGLAGLYALARTVGGRSRPAVSPEFFEHRPERPRREAPPVGAGFERAVATSAAEVADPRAGGEAVRERLRATATAVLVSRADHSPAEAGEAVAAGTWTDDRIAAAFLGGESAPAYPVGERFRGWIRPEVAFRRRVDATVDALADLADRGAIAADRAGADTAVDRGSGRGRNGEADVPGGDGDPDAPGGGPDAGDDEDRPGPPDGGPDATGDRREEGSGEEGSSEEGPGGDPPDGGSPG